MSIVRITSVAFLLTTVPGCRQQRPSNAFTDHTFGIYLVRDGLTVNRACRIPLEALSLGEAPVIGERDIVEYDWDTHTIMLLDRAKRRLPHPPMSGLPFVVVADGVRCYLGGFWSSLSSIGTSVPVINTSSLSGHEPPEGCVRIDRAYPTDRFATGEDPRSDARIRDCLKALGKLRK